MSSKQNCSAIHILSLFFLILLVQSGDSSMSNIFLNSYAHCGHDKTFEVTPDHGYEIKSDVSPDTGTNSFMECETTFHSVREDGQLCLIQEGRLSSIKENNAELVLTDGIGNDEDTIIHTLLYHPNAWRGREYCTETRYIHVYLRKKNKVSTANIRNIFINLRVLDIESRDRFLYMVGLYCENTYKLSNSQVSIYNRPPSDIETDASILNKYCPMRFEKERNETKRICIAYIPTSDMKCDNDWALHTSYAPKASLDNTLLTCTESKEMQIWCESNQTHSLWLILERRTRSESELPKSFRLIVTDYSGTEKSLKEKIIRELNNENGDSNGIAPVVIVVIVLVVLIVCTIIGMFSYRYKTKLRNLYLSVRQKDPTSDG